jgi:YggT family protein
MVHLAIIVRLLFTIYIVLIFIRVMFAWVRPNMFNPVVQFVYNSTNPYLRLFAGIKFLRIGALDLTPILALFLLYVISELSYNVLLKGSINLQNLISMIIMLLFKFVYFILVVFIIVVGLRFIFEIIGHRSNNIIINIIYSVSELAVRPLRNWFKIRGRSGFDIHVLISLVILILLRFLILPRILQLISMLFR